MSAMFFLLLLISMGIQENAADKDYLSMLNITNYTSCEKFLENTTFDPKSVIDIDWKIFYFWNPSFEESYNVQFSLATDVLVDRFRVELDTHMKPPVNWTNAVLFMETTIDFSGLLVKTNTSSIYKLIPTLAFEYSQAPVLTFAFKLVEPGYLGILNCEFRVCYALAPVDKMPNHDYLTQEAQKLGFWNEYGRTHTATIPPMPTIAPEPFEEDDDEEDQHLDIMHHHQNIQFL